MALVDYSGSEESEEEVQETVAPRNKPKSNTAKPAFQKLVDPSNPNKIRITLPDAEAKSKDSSEDVSEPPSKKIKTGQSSFGDFNSLLPAPKRTGNAAGGATNGTGKGLARGVSLKTGATPGFSRELMEKENDAVQEEVQNVKDRPPATHQDSQTPETNHSTIQIPPEKNPETLPDIPKKKATIFKPLSVARKPAKRNIPGSISSAAPILKTTKAPASESAPQRVSLFSTADDAGDFDDTTTAGSSYQPLLVQKDEPSALPHMPSEESHNGNSNAFSTYAPETFSHAQNHDPNSLDSIASDLNLSASAKRQLLGRHHQKGASATPINIVNFNTDQEYAANEVLRKNGESVQHNPVRGIAPGKHSLKQLVNMASNQKDALEEQFASGRRNKSEAGAKYGW